MLVAEISNCHFGDMYRAKELIAAAHGSGADIVKMQAFSAEDIKTGSMPLRFYKQCEFSVYECIELIDYARSIRNDLFFSIFSSKFNELKNYQKWLKISGAQYANEKFTMSDDIETTIVSIPERAIPLIRIPKNASVMYVSAYLAADPGLHNIKKISDQMGRQCGYSDHTVGIEWCKQAIDIGANILEKHFCLKKNESWEGKLYRDTVFGSDPKEFKELSNYINER